MAKTGNGKNPAKIKVVGVGGAGGNAVSRMKEDFVRGVEFVAINTDVQDLEYCDAHFKLQIGKNVTRGLGAGMNPELGRQAAEENRAEIAEALKGVDMVFITLGFGGGTGSSASVVTAEVAKENGALVVAVATKPFTFEGGQRTRIAQEYLSKLKEKVDAFIVIPNDRIFNIISKDTSIIRAFEAIDGVLRNAVSGIAELITMPGIINVDFADVRTIMENSGTAIVGIGLASGQNRAAAAVSQAINSPLLELTLEGARGVLFGVSGGRDLKMHEINEVAQVIAGTIDPGAKIIFGAYHDRKLKSGQLKVTLVATGFNGGGLTKAPETVLSNLFAGPPRLEERDESRRGQVRPPPPAEKPAPAPEIKPAAGKSLWPLAGSVRNGVSGAGAPAEALETKSENNQEKKKGKEVKDIWDIPAFLRKKRH